MTKDELAELAKRWAEDDAVRETHYDGCIYDSPGCAINDLIATIEAMDAALGEIVELNRCGACDGAGGDCPKCDDGFKQIGGGKIAEKAVLK